MDDYQFTTPTGFWAVVTSVAREKYLCFVPAYEAEDLEKLEPINVEEAYEFEAAKLPMRGPNGEMALTKQPFIGTLDFASSRVPLRLRPASYYRLDALQGSDVALYKNFLKQANAAVEHDKATKAGIQLPSTSDIAAISRTRGGGNA